MGRLPSTELWRRHTLERFIAFKQSGELERLRRKGLAICGRKKRFTGGEWFKSFGRRYSSPEYLEWYHECETVAQRFGLAPWIVYCSCLVSGYKPEEEPFPVEAEWPRIRVVTNQSNPLFLEWLSYEAHRLGLYVIQRVSSVEVTHIPPNFPPSEPLLASERPLRDCAFYMRVESPLGYPPQAAQDLEKQAKRLEKELLRRLGYSVSERLRSSPLVAIADKLRVGKNLAPGEAYQVIDDIYGEDLTNDRERRKLVGSRRNKLQKRLVNRYEPMNNNPVQRDGV